MPPDPAPVAGFLLQPFETTARELVPTIGATPLIDLVTDYERTAGMQPVGGYAGLVLGHFDVGDPAEYLLGRGRSRREDRVPLLGCECGDSGCWPLLAKVTVADGKVVWSDFAQPHRSDRDYSGFGPFRFPEPDYRASVAEVVTRLAQTS